MPSPIHLRLRDATRAAHERLEIRIDLLNRVADRTQRIVLAQGFLRLHAAIEGAAEPWLASRQGLDFAARRRTPILRRDLAALGALAPCQAEHLSAPSEAWALGLLYVAEGSTLGGQVLRRELAARGEDFTGLGFLDPYAADVGRRWRDFQAVLAETPTGRADDLVAGALAGFALGERLLCMEAGLV